MNILITGTEGYLGALLAPALLRRGHLVIGVDTGFYKSGWLYNGTPVTAKTLNKDIRQIGRIDLAGIEAIIHLAELPDDANGQISGELIQEINLCAAIRLARLAKSAGVRRFVYLSSTSVYGAFQGEEVTEDSPVNPQTLQAKCKVLVEHELSRLADLHFSPTSLRSVATFGASPRMRFDLLINQWTGLAWTQHEPVIPTKGWLPLIHALDLIQAVVRTVESSRGPIHNQVLNVGYQNYACGKIAEVIAQQFPAGRLQLVNNEAVLGNHRVGFAKLYRCLPQFQPTWDLSRGVAQLYDLFCQLELTRETFQSRRFNRLKQLEYLRRTCHLNPDLFWHQTTNSQPRGMPLPAASM